MVVLPVPSAQMAMFLMVSPAFGSRLSALGFRPWG